MLTEESLKLDCCNRKPNRIDKLLIRMPAALQLEVVL
jgi:hypothetical protein